MNNQNNVQDQVGSQPQQNVGAGGRVLVVRATHEYQPVNMDELHIKPGDEIVITNQENGNLNSGWFEGTLGCKTGWFPSNYVVPVDDLGRVDKMNEMSCYDEYKGIIVKELVDSEGVYVREMEEFYDRVLKGIQGLVRVEDGGVVEALQGSYGGLISSHREGLLGPLQRQVDEGMELRVGLVFMNAALRLTTAHTTYCSQHPRFVQLIERNQEKLSGVFGDQSGVLKMITCLSAPFRRVERIGKTLCELERYISSGDVDRGDLQRSVSYYKDLEKSLTSLRKQKELEIEICSPGNIVDLEGPDVSTLGDIILMNLLFVGRDKQPRYFVLFSNTILILSYDNLSNTLTYKGRVYVSGITVSCCDGDESLSNAFEISGPTIHPIIVQCPSPAIRNTWLTQLNELLRATRCYSVGIHSNQSHLAAPQQTQSLGSNVEVIGALGPPLRAWSITRLRPTPCFNPFLAEYKGGKGTLRSSSSSSGFERGGGGSFKFKSGSFSGGIGGGVEGGVSNEQDLCLLQIVDGMRGGDGMKENKCLRPGGDAHQLATVAMQRSLSSEAHVGVRSHTFAQQQRKKKYSWCCTTAIDSYDNDNRSSVPINNSRNLSVTRPVTFNKNLASPNILCHSNGLGGVGGGVRVQQPKLLSQIVYNLREDVTILNEKIGQLARQLEEDRSLKGQLIELITRLGNTDVKNGNLS